MIKLSTLDVIEMPCWKLYDLDSDCDLLVINSLGDVHLDVGYAQLSLSYLNKLANIIPTVYFADDITSRVDYGILKDIKCRCWLQEKNDPIPFNFITKLENHSYQLDIVDFRGIQFSLTDVESILGKFLLGELLPICRTMFYKLMLINPELQETQFNFGFALDQTVKLIGCPGHLVNSVYSDSFHQKFKEFWTSP